VDYPLAVGPSQATRNGGTHTRNGRAGAAAAADSGCGTRQQQQQQMAATTGSPPAAVSTALDVRIHCALNIGRPLSAVRVEARLGGTAQVSAAVSADAGVACFNAWGRMPVAEGVEYLQLKVRQLDWAHVCLYDSGS